MDVMLNILVDEASAVLVLVIDVVASDVENHYYYPLPSSPPW